jgi:hypothetical protein
VRAHPLLARKIRWTCAAALRVLPPLQRRHPPEDKTGKKEPATQ